MKINNRRQHTGIWFNVIIYVGIGTAIISLGIGLYLDPTKTWLKQNREMGALNKSVDEARDRNESLRREMKELESNEYIERKAREELGLVKPGEEAFVVVDPEQAPAQPKRPGPVQDEGFLDKIKRFIKERDAIMNRSGE